MSKAKAEAALRGVAAAMKSSSVMQPMAALELLGGLQLDDDEEELQRDMRETVAKARRWCKAGDAVKYVEASKQMCCGAGTKV